ncbi:uncharacterized protein N7515_006175 [Penicillium bovifimosum]|uniref:Tyrosine specific protein phosphatases domain-containing protein n=1 Tax=Penicillium bovifimosum TaxID=126998 RepID=A0A9W9GVJ9_9EURO|nr:uncharacterized protein N7515_006175 [Penicillium bovifimosum]KAJ5130136.1 hypothetical protein N7515_006175 [Penicillium bovifimosum]
MSRHNSVDLDSPDRPFDNIINFRDIGRSINQFCRKERVLPQCKGTANPVQKETKREELIKSQLDDASERDKRRLAEELNIYTVIDLRSQTEHQMATRKRRSEIANSLDSSSSDSSTDLTEAPVPSNPEEHLLDIPNSQRALISLTGKGFERALLSKLDWFTYIKVITLATTGYRSDAIRLICSTVMLPRGLTGLAQDTLESSTAEMRSVFEILAREESYPVLVHCTQGKDRTGLVVLLVLLLVGMVPTDAMVDDYSRSEGELVSEFEERLEEIRAIGLDEEYTRCPDGFVEKTVGFLERFGGVRGYLERIGIGLELQERIRGMLLV